MGGGGQKLLKMALITEHKHQHWDKGSVVQFGCHQHRYYEWKLGSVVVRATITKE